MDTVKSGSAAVLRIPNVREGGREGGRGGREGGSFTVLHSLLLSLTNILSSVGTGPLSIQGEVAGNACC